LKKSGKRVGELRENPEARLLSAYAADSHRAWADWLINSQTQYGC
jgi:hypothetical protein